KKGIPNVKEHCDWYLLDDSKPNELIDFVTLFGVSRSKYVAHQFVRNHRELLVSGWVDKKGNGILPVEATIPLPEAFDFKHAKEIRRSSGIDDEVVKDQRQRDDNDLQDERQDQPKEKEVEPRRSKRARTEKLFGPDFVFLWKKMNLLLIDKR
nr:hypothetical protein [Tanacetum cinerariifolium]